MSTVVECPTCKAKLVYPDGASSAVFTCPRCLGQVAANAPPAAAAPTGTQAPVARCAGCGNGLGRGSPFCNYCGKPTSSSVQWTPGAGAQANTDLRSVGWAFVIIAILSLVGLAFLAVSNANVVRDFTMWAVGGLALVCAVTGVLTWVVSPKGPDATVEKRETAKVVPIIGGVIGAMALTVVAFSVLCLVVCGPSLGVRSGPNSSSSGAMR